LGGNDFEQNTVVDYLALYIVTSALDQAKQNVRLLFDSNPNIVKPKDVPPKAEVPKPVSNEPIDINIIQEGDIVGTISVKAELPLVEVRNIILSEGIDVKIPFIFFQPDKKPADEKSPISSVLTSSPDGFSIVVGQQSINLINVATKDIVGEVSGFDSSKYLTTLRNIMKQDGIPDGWPDFLFCSATGAPLTTKQEENRSIKEIIKDGNILVKLKK